MHHETFEAIGGFDERFFLFVEDTDLCLRLSQHGYETWFVPEANAVHQWGGSSTDRSNLIAWHTASMEAYFRKHYPDATLRNSILFLLLHLNCRLRQAREDRQ